MGKVWRQKAGDKEKRDQPFDAIKIKSHAIHIHLLLTFHLRSHYPIWEVFLAAWHGIKFIQAPQSDGFVWLSSQQSRVTHNTSCFPLDSLPTHPLALCVALPHLMTNTASSLPPSPTRISCVLNVATILLLLNAQQGRIVANMLATHLWWWTKQWEFGEEIKDNWVWILSFLVIPLFMLSWIPGQRHRLLLYCLPLCWLLPRIPTQLPFQSLTISHHTIPCHTIPQRHPIPHTLRQPTLPPGLILQECTGTHILPLNSFVTNCIDPVAFWAM